MELPALILVLGDQLHAGRGALKDARPGIDTVLMAEVSEEASYVRHNRHKIAFIFSAMRHFRDELRDKGFEVLYYAYEERVQSLHEAVLRGLKERPSMRVRCCEPGEYRLRNAMDHWRLPVSLDLVEDDHFLASHGYFSDWASGRKQLRMEYFYREMRRKYHVLLDSKGAPEGGKWNYDSENRRGWRNKDTIPCRPKIDIDEVTAEVLALVSFEFPEHPGNLDQFYLGVTAAQAENQLQWFLEHGLPGFGRYQDALAEESPWLYHSLISMYLNIGLLDPLEVCHAVENAWREGHCDLATAEGFIRQVLGWREYVRGIYWMTAPSYADRNALQARRSLPQWFWTGDTDMRCLELAIGQTLDLGYAHHIQRLMVIGNFALLSGLDVKQVCDWYLAVYVDAFEWVELPNTLGMALHADGGLMGSKPYAASGKYIQRQGNHCANCRHHPVSRRVPGRVPITACTGILWIDTLAPSKKNPRMNLTMSNWRRKSHDDQLAILKWADAELDRLVPHETG